MSRKKGGWAAAEDDAFGKEGEGGRGKGVAGEEKRIQVLLVNEVTKLLKLCR